jgi:hypothetical protein
MGDDNIMKRFFSSLDERILKDQTDTMYEEVSDGIYLIVKDRLGVYKEEFVSQAEVIEDLNSNFKTVVVHRGGSSGYANFLFDTRY